LPTGLWGNTGIYQNGYLYVVGGTDQLSATSAINTVYYSKRIGIGGEISSFTATTPLSDNRNGHGMVCYNDMLIVTGGFDNSGNKTNTVFHTSLNIDGTCGTWNSAANLPSSVSNHGNICNNGLISVIGGETSSGLSDEVYYANIDDFPALTWNLSADLLYEARKDGSAYFSNGQIVYSGGENISAQPIHNTRYATLNLTGDKVHKGSFLSNPFFQLGEERDITSLTYNMTFDEILNNYDLIYRLAGSDQLWGDWVEVGQDNPALVGEQMQYVQYLIKFDGSDDDNIVLHDLTVNISGNTQLSGNLNGMDTLKLEHSPYWATGSISFTGGTHYIEPGVTILFSPNTGLEIGQANMVFNGTEENPIILTSYSDESGLWNGVYFNSSSNNGVASVLNYVTIEKAGAGSWNANLYCVSTNEPQINNSTFRLADGNGITLNDADLSIANSVISNTTENGCYILNSSPSFSNTEFLSNGVAGVHFADVISNPNFFNCNIDGNYFGIYYPSPNSSFPVISGISSYNNTISGIAIGGGTISSDQTWPFNLLGYAVVGDVTIAKKDSHARLTIMPGNTIYFDTLVKLQVGQYEYYLKEYGGELYAIGTADSTITFTSINGQPGGWNGIYFHNNSDSFGSTSELKHCIIQNGNSYNIKCEQTIQPGIDNCVINNSNKYDIYAQDPNSVPHITASTSTVYVDGGTQSINKTWYNFGDGDYIILNDIIVAKKNDKVTLTIQPGITIKADTSALLQIAQYVYYLKEYGGELFAEGTADSLITFTSRNGLVGGWDGIYFHYNSNSFGSTSSLKFCTIEKGNNFNIKSSGSDQPQIDNCTINNTNGYDIWAVAPNDVQHVTNTISTLYVGEGVQSWNKTWWNFGGEYVILGNIIVAKQNSFSTLTIEPGNIINFDSGIQFQVGQYAYYMKYYGGEIIAKGTLDSTIIFRSLENTPGNWNGFYFHEFADNYGGLSSFEYCIVDGAAANNLYCHNTNNLHFEHVTFINSAGNGVHLYNSSPYLKLCQVVNNDSIGVKLTGSSNPVIGDTLGLGCDIYGNGEYGIYNATGNLISAKNNFWNSTDSTEIAGRIFDYYNNASYGIVEFMPVATTSYFDNHPPDKFNLISIPDYGATSDQSPAFTWEITTDANGDTVTYYYYYTDDSTWNSNLLKSEELSSPNYTIPVTLTGGKWYWWRVKATDGFLSRYSNQTWRFAVSLPPSVPEVIVPPNGTLMHDSDYLSWVLSSDPDVGDYVSHYHIQIDDDTDFSSPAIDMTGINADTKSSSISLRINELTNYLSLENKTYYWRVSAIDGFGIESDFSDGTNHFLYQLKVYLKVYLEGPYTGSDMSTSLNTLDLLPLLQPYNTSPWNYMEYESVTVIPNNQVVDWVLIQFRSTPGDPSMATNATTIFTKAAFLLADGSIVDLDGISPFEFPVSFDDNTYVVIYHRNHLPIISAYGLSVGSEKYEYDFSLGSSRVYGGSAGYNNLGSGVWGMAGGNADANKIINESDIDDVWSVEAGNPGYLQSDFNWDAEANNRDKDDVLVPNIGKESQVPE
jgi:hypothetical protein